MKRIRTARDPSLRLKSGSAQDDASLFLQPQPEQQAIHRRARAKQRVEWDEDPLTFGKLLSDARGARPVRGKGCAHLHCFTFHSFH